MTLTFDLLTYLMNLSDRALRADLKNIWLSMVISKNKKVIQERHFDLWPVHNSKTVSRTELKLENSAFLTMNYLYTKFHQNQRLWVTGGGDIDFFWRVSEYSDDSQKNLRFTERSGHFGFDNHIILISESIELKLFIWGFWSILNIIAVSGF